ncbi:MAG TPA: hypothetical protein VMD52_08285 [Patescibacteria group bacterium]|nr:hypothetical protein [Patescibacteria group bacterium]
MVKRIATVIALCACVQAFPLGIACRASQVSYEELRRTYIPQSSPEASYRLEYELMLKGMYCYDLPLFDPDWRRKGREIIFSSAYRQTAQGFDAPFMSRIEGSYAVIYYPDNKDLGPVFLYRDRSGWVVDRTSVMDNITYSSSNKEWFAQDGDYPYLAILKRAFSMEKVRLNSGAWAYRVR